MLVRYIRNQNRVPYGCIVAVGPGKVGWSRCHPTKDKFSKKMGRRIAAGRAMKHPEYNLESLSETLCREIRGKSDKDKRDAFVYFAGKMYNLSNKYRFPNSVESVEKEECYG